MTDQTSFGYGEIEYGKSPYGRFIALEGSGLSVTRTYEKNNQFWFETEWMELQQITDDQYNLAVITYVDDRADSHVADVYIEHTDSLTSGQVTRSDKVSVTRDEDVDEIESLDAIEGDYYRLQVTNYQGENVVDNLNIGLIH